MGFKHNNVLHANHFRKDWQRRVRTWFEQPGRKLRRRLARTTKGAALGPRPAALLRPAVHAQTLRYNNKIRRGRGFTLAELSAAGIKKSQARGLGIVVDHRRRNVSEEGKAFNVQRLKTQKEVLVVLPAKGSKTTHVDPLDENLKTQAKHQMVDHFHTIPLEVPRQISSTERNFLAYHTLRVGRADQRFAGVRKIRASKKEEEENNKKK